MIFIKTYECFKKGKDLKVKSYNSYFEEYVDKIGEPIPLMQIMGNEVYCNKFDQDPELVYKYCLENNKKWEEVLNYTFDPEALY